LTVLGKFEPQNVVGHRVDPQKALPYVTTHVLSYCQSKSIHEWLQSGEKWKRSLIFHVFRQTLPYGQLAQIWVMCSSHGHNQLCQVLS